MSRARRRPLGAAVCVGVLLEAAIGTPGKGQAATDSSNGISCMSGRKLLLCGNGGSAAGCQHVAAEFVSRLRADFQRPALPALALTTDTSFLIAFASD